MPMRRNQSLWTSRRCSSHKVLIEPRCNLQKSAAKVLVQRVNDVGNRLSVDGVFVRINSRPNCSACLCLVEFDLERNSRDDLRLIHFSEFVDLALNNVVGPEAVARCVHRLEFPRGAEQADQRILNDTIWRLHPSMVFVRADFMGGRPDTEFGRHA